MMAHCLIARHIVLAVLAFLFIAATALLGAFSIESPVPLYVALPKYSGI